MRLEKGKAIVKKTYSNVYKIHLKFMIGDADGYEYETLYIPSDNKHIERFINFLDECSKAYPNGRGGGDRDNYQKVVPEWEIFCGYSPLDDKDLKKFRFDWPYDQYGDCQTSFDSYTITYFDENSIEYEVTIKK